MASRAFTNLTRNLCLGRHNFSSDTLKILLVSSIPSEANFDAWISRADITNEITGTGYTAGGIAQAYTFNAVDAANNRNTISFTDIVNGWTAATFSAVGAITYKNSGVAATDYLIGFHDFNGTITCNNGTFSIDHTSDFLVTAL